MQKYRFSLGPIRWPPPWWARSAAGCGAQRQCGSAKSRPRLLFGGLGGLHERSMKALRGFLRASASKMRSGSHFGPTFGPPKRPRAPEKSLESLQRSLKIKVLPFPAWIVFGPRFWTLLGTFLGGHLAPRQAETDLLGGLGPSKSRFQLVFWGPIRVQERSKRRPRGQRPPEQISRSLSWAPRSVWDPF